MLSDLLSLGRCISLVTKLTLLVNVFNKQKKKKKKKKKRERKITVSENLSHKYFESMIYQNSPWVFYDLAASRTKRLLGLTDQLGL